MNKPIKPQLPFNGKRERDVCVSLKDETTLKYILEQVKDVPLECASKIKISDLCYDEDIAVLKGRYTVSEETIERERQQWQLAQDQYKFDVEKYNQHLREVACIEAIKLLQESGYEVMRAQREYEG